MSFAPSGTPDDFYGPDWRDDATDAGWIDPVDVSRAMIDVMNERQRQQDEEGWTPEHDDQHGEAVLARAAACYAVYGSRMTTQEPPTWWPFNPIWWKPKDRRRDLIRAAALIVAEIERLDRAEARDREPET